MVNLGLIKGLIKGRYCDNQSVLVQKIVCRQVNDKTLNFLKGHFINPLDKNWQGSTAIV